MNKYKIYIRDMFLTVIVLGVTFLINLVLQNIFKTQSFSSDVFILGVFLISLKTEGYLWGILASLVSVLVESFAFTFPYFVLDFAAVESLFSAVVMLIVAVLTSALTTKIKEQERTKTENEKERVRANLLRAISHDLRTPLTSISGNAGVLMANGEGLGTEKCKQLYTAIYDDSLWLINLVENLLSVTRIEDGTMQLKLTAELVDEAVAEAVRHISRQSAEHHIIIRQQEVFLLAKMDARLIVQVIINIVDNAVKYTPKGSTITITTRKEGKWAAVEIADDGPGIPDDAKPRIFDMFYTAGAHSADSRRSLGLGLALCKSIINAHGGEISVADNQPSGTIFRFTLPAEEVTLHA